MLTRRHLLRALVATVAHPLAVPVVTTGGIMGLLGYVQPLPAYPRREVEPEDCPSI